jgi:hypothetical protein
MSTAIANPMTWYDVVTPGAPRTAERTRSAKAKWPGQCPAIVLEISAFDLRL